MNPKLPTCVHPQTPSPLAGEGRGEGEPNGKTLNSELLSPPPFPPPSRGREKSGGSGWKLTRNSQLGASKGHPAVFMDRDGTICEEVGYLDSIKQMRLIPRSAAAIKLLNNHGFKAVIVTNQSGVARGYFPESRLEDLHAELAKKLRQDGAFVDAIYYCPHHPTEGIPPYLQDCNCRKPAPGLLLKAAADLNIHLPSSYMVGDHLSDIECGQRVGAETILLLTGHGWDSLGKLESNLHPPTHIAADLYEAVQWVIEHSERV